LGRRATGRRTHNHAALLLHTIRATEGARGGVRHLCTPACGALSPATATPFGCAAPFLLLPKRTRDGGRQCGRLFAYGRPTKARTLTPPLALKRLCDLSAPLPAPSWWVHKLYRFSYRAWMARRCRTASGNVSGARTVWRCSFWSALRRRQRWTGYACLVTAPRARRGVEDSSRCRFALLCLPRDSALFYRRKYASFRVSSARAVWRRSSLCGAHYFLPLFFAARMPRPGTCHAVRCTRAVFLFLFACAPSLLLHIPFGVTVCGRVRTRVDLDSAGPFKLPVARAGGMPFLRRTLLLRATCALPILRRLCSYLPFVTLLARCDAAPPSKRAFRGLPHRNKTGYARGGGGRSVAALLCCLRICSFLLSST